MAIVSESGLLEAGTAAGGELRWVAVDITAPVRFVRRRLDLSPVAAAALGRSLAGAAMLLRLSSKSPWRLVLEVRGSGPIRKVMAEADQEGNLRGLVGEPQVEVAPYANRKLAVGTAVGRGVLSVLREYTEGGRYQSQVELVSGEIGLDIAYFLQQSEQRDSAVMVGVLTRPQRIAAAGGFVVEALPGASREAVSRLESNIEALGEVSRALEGDGLAGARAGVLAGLEPRLQEESELRYHCRCSRERLLGHLLGLSVDQLDELVLEEEEPAQAECGFCGAVYLFQRSELRPQ